MRSGCFYLVLRICVTMMAARLIVSGFALLFSFPGFTLGPPSKTG